MNTSDHLQHEIARLVPDAPEWHSRGYLPHFDNGENIQHVTWHLADSLPKDVVGQLDAALKEFPVDKQDIERRKRVDAWIDAGNGCCVLREQAVATLVQDAFLRFDTIRYRLLAWVVMPNHVHVLFQPVNGWSVAKIVSTWKAYTGRSISTWMRNNSRITPGNARHQPAAVWHREYWDRFIRNEQHLAQAIEYIHQNPVKAGLVKSAEDWQWSSAYPSPGPPGTSLATTDSPG